MMWAFVAGLALLAAVAYFAIKIRQDIVAGRLALAALGTIGLVALIFTIWLVATIVALPFGTGL